MWTSRTSASIMPTMSSIECSNAPASPFFLAKSQKEQDSTHTFVGLTYRLMTK